MNEKEHDKEIGRWQEAIYNLIKESTGSDSEIDGAGCDSGDPLDFTLSEISQGFGIFQNRIEEMKSALQRMVAMHETMMEKVNHGASFYDGKTIQEMNEAPIQARRALSGFRGNYTYHATRRVNTMR